MQLRDLSGQSFGKITVVRRAQDFVRSNGRKDIAWECVCSCGATTNVRSDRLVRGVTKSCGCWRIEQPTKHGGSYRKEYRSWKNIIQRCSNSKNPKYADYGGRGIRVCERWQTFDAFFADMKECQRGDMSIERKDNNKGYEPGNCIWATPAEQSKNRRMPTSNTSGATGVVLDTRTGQWVAQIGVKRRCIRLGKFDTFEEAVQAKEEANKKYGFSEGHGSKREKT